jgi:putative transposase
VYLKDYADGWQAERSLADYFQFYCQRRIHQALGYRTPAQVYGQGIGEHTKRSTTISG